MGPSLSLLHSSLLLQAIDAAHKLKPKDKKSILVRTGSTIPGKYQYYRGSVWLQSVLHSCFPQGFLTFSTPVIQTSPFLWAMYVLLPSPLSSIFLPWASARQPKAGEQSPQVLGEMIEASDFFNCISRISLLSMCYLPEVLLQRNFPLNEALLVPHLLPQWASNQFLQFLTPLLLSSFPMFLLQEVMVKKKKPIKLSLHKPGLWHFETAPTTDGMARGVLSGRAVLSCEYLARTKSSRRSRCTA